MKTRNYTVKVYNSGAFIRALDFTTLFAAENFCDRQYKKYGDTVCCEIYNIHTNTIVESYSA